MCVASVHVISNGTAHTKPLGWCNIIPHPSSCFPDAFQELGAAACLFGVELQGSKAAAESDMFVAEAFEERKQGAFEHLGEVGRMLRRYQQQPDPGTLQLSHCIRSIDQVGHEQLHSPLLMLVTHCVTSFMCACKHCKEVLGTCR